MATATVFDSFFNNLAQKLGDLDSDTLKAVLTLTAPVQATSEVIGDLTQIAGTGGYAAVTLTGVTLTEVSPGVWELDCNPIQWTASGANFASARYLAIYDDTATNDFLICFVDYGASFTLTDGNTFTATPGANGAIRFTRTP